MMTYELSLKRTQTLDAKIASLEHRLGLQPSGMVSHNIEDMFPSYSSLSHATAMPSGFVYLDFHGVHFFVAPLKRTSDQDWCQTGQRRKRFDPFSDLSFGIDSLNAYHTFATKTD